MPFKDPEKRKEYHRRYQQTHPQKRSFVDIDNDVEIAAIRGPHRLLLCLNCDVALGVPHLPLLFCGEACRQEAKYIRYYRSVLREGRDDDPDIRDALQIRRAFIYAGGYPDHERNLTADQRAAVIERDGGLCQVCGQPGKEIDHIGGPIEGEISHPDNLQLLVQSVSYEQDPAFPNTRHLGDRS